MDKMAWVESPTANWYEALDVEMKEIGTSAISTVLGVEDSRRIPADLPIVSTPEEFVASIPTDLMNQLLSFLSFSDYRSLSLVTKNMNVAVSRASHIFMGEPSIDRATSSLRLDESSLQKLLERFESLRVLELDGLAPVGDHLFRLLNESTAAKTIQSLSLNGVSLTYWCPDILNLRQLRHLRISGGSIRASLKSLFGSESFNLKSLSISKCSSLRDAQIADMVHSLGGSLTHLSLNQCLRIKKPSLRFQHVERLSLMGCFALTALPNFCCPSLKVLDLSFCFRIDTRQIHQTLLSTPNLKELILVKCPAVSSLNIRRLPSLRVLNVSFCHNLHMLRASCPGLTHLDTTGCSALETLLLDAGQQLLSLDLSRLLSLTRLEVTATHLQCLYITDCRRLDHVSLQPGLSLHTVNLRGSRTVALRFCKSVRRVILHDWMQRRTRTAGPNSSSADGSMSPALPFRTTAMVQ